MNEFLMVLGIIIGVILLYFIVCFFVFGNIIRLKAMGLGKRYDDNGTLHYFTINDYPGLKVEKTIFSNGKQKLMGYIYQMEKSNKDAYIVIAHGLGAGHVQYMNEIAYFASRGYQVFTYDMRACLNSEGKKIGYFSNALIDFDAALRHAESLDIFKNRPIFLFGHSMGGYCVNNAFSFEGHNIKACVSLAGFDNPYSLLNQFLGKHGKIFVDSLKFHERMVNKEVAKYSSIESLKKAQCPVLLISGDKDPLVLLESNFNLYKKELVGFDNISFMLVKDRFHRPNLSLKASEYDQEVNKKINDFWRKKSKKISAEEIKKFYNSFDYKLLVEFDENVMNQVLDFYSKVEIL